MKTIQTYSPFADFAFLQLNLVTFRELPQGYEHKFTEFPPHGYLDQGGYEHAERHSSSFRQAIKDTLPRDLEKSKHFGREFQQSGARGVAYGFAGVHLSEETPEKRLANEDGRAARLRTFRHVIATGRKQFFIKGFSGLVSKKVEQGDIICLICGLNIPFVLRPKENRYTLMGQCFVEGNMTGEAVVRWQATNGNEDWNQLETFQIE